MARLLSDDALAVATIWQEARGEPYAGKVAVAEVIRNRTVEHYQSDGTVAGTVLRTFQFSGWNSGDPNRIKAAKIDDDDPIVQDCLKAWHEAVQGSQTVNGALLYFNPAIVAEPAWAQPSVATQVAEVGAHRFFVPTPTKEV